MTWPASKLIRITTGSYSGDEIKDVLAARDSDGDYIIIEGIRIGDILIRGVQGDEIAEWDDIALVPAHALNHLRLTFQGVKLPATQQAALQEVISYTPTTPTPLQEAVAKTKEAAASTPDGTMKGAWLAILLTCLAETAANPGWSKPLIEMTATAARWAQLLSPGLDTLNAAAARAEKTPTYMSLANLASLLEKIADDIDNCMGDSSIREHLEDLARYTLNWAAYLIEHNK